MLPSRTCCDQLLCIASTLTPSRNAKVVFLSPAIFPGIYIGRPSPRRSYPTWLATQTKNACDVEKARLMSRKRAPKNAKSTDFEIARELRKIAREFRKIARELRHPHPARTSPKRKKHSGKTKRVRVAGKRFVSTSPATLPFCVACLTVRLIDWTQHPSRVSVWSSTPLVWRAIKRGLDISYFGLGILAFEPPCFVGLKGGLEISYFGLGILDFQPPCFVGLKGGLEISYIEGSSTLTLSATPELG